MTTVNKEQEIALHKIVWLEDWLVGRLNELADRIIEGHKLIEQTSLAGQAVPAEWWRLLDALKQERLRYLVRLISIYPNYLAALTLDEQQTVQRQLHYRNQNTGANSVSGVS